MHPRVIPSIQPALSSSRAAVSRTLVRVLAVGATLLAFHAPAHAQLRNGANLNWINHRLSGQIVDYTHNHGVDRRIFSPILGAPRDMYVYLPPGYSRACAYPVLLYFPMAAVDEHAVFVKNHITELDRMIQRGEFPPVIVACPDGIISGTNRFREPHSLYVNGQNGRFQDHIIQEVIPFLTANYPIRPERQAHAILGASAGGFGAMGIAIKYRSYFGIVATLAGPLNMRYDSCVGDYRENFDPATFRWKERYDPEEIVGRFYLGLSRVRAKKYVTPVFGEGDAVSERIRRENPADLLISTGLQPNELAIYVNYPGKDNWNFDAQAESFVWLAAQRGIAVTAEKIPCAKHTLPYFRQSSVQAYQWMSSRLLPPVALVAR